MLVNRLFAELCLLPSINELFLLSLAFINQNQTKKQKNRQEKKNCFVVVVCFLEKQKLLNSTQLKQK